MFTVYRLTPGIYGLITTEVASPVPHLSHIAESLTTGKLNLYRAGSEVNLDKTSDVYLFGDQMAIYDEALRRVTRIYDDAKFEKDVGVYFRMTCGWLPSEISADGRIMKTSCYCLNCVMMKRSRDIKGEGDEDFRQEYKMYHNYCDMCGGCVATLTTMNKTKCKLDLTYKGWTVDQRGFAIPLNTKPVTKKKVLPVQSLPKLTSTKRYSPRSEKKVLEQHGTTLSLPYVDSNGMFSPRPMQSSSSPNMYMDNWWWKEMEQTRQQEMEGLRQGDGTEKNPSEVELAEYNEELRLKQKQRLQEIKAEMQMHRESPASEQREPIDEELSPPFPVQDESSVTQDPDDVTNHTPFYNEDPTSLSSTKKVISDDSVSQIHVSAHTSNDLLTKQSDKDFSYYFRNLNSQRKASWVRHYVEPPSVAPSKIKTPKSYLNSRASNVPRKRIPPKLPPVYKDTNLGPLTSRLSMKVKYRPSKMMNAQKKKSKKKPRKSSSLSSTETSRESVNSRSSSSVSGSDSMEGLDYFEHNKRKGWPTSIEGIFKRTLPLLRKNLSTSVRQNVRIGQYMEGDDDDDLAMFRSDQRSREVGPNEQGDADVTHSDRSDLKSMQEYDMCDDADAMRRMWKLCFPEVNFWDRRRRSRKSRKKILAAA